MSRPFLAISMGDPVGIGPEVTVKAASVKDVRAEADLVVVGDAGVLRAAVRETSIGLEIVEVADVGAARSVQAPGQLAVVSVTSLASVKPASPDAESDRAQGAYVEVAFHTVHGGKVDAMVTAPINKSAMRRAGSRWTGHTEMLADLSTEHAREGETTFRPVMMLAGPTLKVVPLTTHLPLAEVSRRITKERVLHAVRVTDDAFKRHFGRHRPRIAVAGVNPHAGEGGLFGDEERAQIVPAIQEGQKANIGVSGPFPADTVFHRAVSGEFDVVIGMYHDQALIPIKLLDFDRAVNVTLGLPVIRTSVDHGTAYDIAGRGVASARSMIEALRLAARMVRDGQSGPHEENVVGA